MNELEKFLRTDYKNRKDLEYLFEMRNGKYVGITFGEFIENVNYLASYFITHGYKGKNIGIYSPNSIAWMIADVAIMNYVGLSIGLSKDWIGDNLEYSINKCEIACLLFSKTLGEMVDEVREKHPDVKFICIEDEFDKMLEEGKASLANLFSFEPVDENKPSKIVFTSGSTSFPKGVMLSIKNIFASYEALAKRIHLDENDVCYLFLPLNHTYGSIYNFLYSLVFGYKVYLANDVKNMVHEMAIVKPTVYCAVPLIFMKFYEASCAHNVTINTLLGGKLKYLFCGGSSLPHDIRKVYMEQGLNIMNSYGLSETSSALAIDYPDVEDMDSSGTVLEYVDAKVINPDKDGVGELSIKGPNIFCGYYNDEESTKKVFDKDGYFLTGDLGKIVNNKVYVKGRMDSTIVLCNGENVSSKRIIDKVKEADSRIVSVRAYIRDSFLTCDIYVNGKENMEGDWQAVIDKANKKLSKYEKIRKFSINDKSSFWKG